MVFNLTAEKRDELKQEIMELLTEYEYNPTEYGVDSILNEWAKNKGSLIEKFVKHPNYNGKFQIVQTEDYHRKIDSAQINQFVWWIRRNLYSHCCEEIDFWGEVYYKWTDLCSGQFVTEELANWMNEHCTFIEGQNNHKIVAAGQKFSRAIGKICRLSGLDKLQDYHDNYTPFADACNPLKVTRYTILSCNPIDYYTMSFGNNWASCQTIDKNNRRHMPNSYEGMYSSGTESYMLDESSFVVYTIDKSYTGNMWELQPKISRQMFHLGGNHEDTTCGTTLIQGRLYPQDNDSGAKDLYDSMRAIVQRTLTECMGIGNLWKNKKGSCACSDVVEDTGTHYKDYRCFDNCNVSFLMVDGKYNEENAIVRIGHYPICPNCGELHHGDDCIECNGCYDGGSERCEYCGGRVDLEYGDGVVVDGRYYCCAECAENDGYRYVNDRDDWYYGDDCFWDEYDEEYHLYRDGYEEMYDGTCFADSYHAEQMGYRYIDAGSRKGEWRRESDTRYCDECGSTVWYRDYNEEWEMCNDCAEDKAESGDKTDAEVEAESEETIPFEFNIGDRVVLSIPTNSAQKRVFAGSWNTMMESYVDDNVYAYIIGKWRNYDTTSSAVGYEVARRSNASFRDWIWDARFMRKVG